LSNNKARIKWVSNVVLPGMMLLVLLSGCGPAFDLIDRYLADEEDMTPTELMEQGREDFDKGYYSGAVDAFERIKDRYPYSKHAIEAELKMADALYEKKAFVEAVESYDDFEKLHPNNKFIPYVIYQKGMCYYQQIRTIDRQQTRTLQAKGEFERVVKRFPRSEFADRARKKIRDCLIFLAEYELYVGHFYFKQGNYRAAMGRYNFVIKNYPDVGQYHEALEYIRRCKEKLTEGEVAQKKEAKT